MGIAFGDPSSAAKLCTLTVLSCALLEHLCHREIQHAPRLAQRRLESILTEEARVPPARKMIFSRRKSSSSVARVRATESLSSFKAGAESLDELAVASRWWKNVGRERSQTGVSALRQADWPSSPRGQSRSSYTASDRHLFHALSTRAASILVERMARSPGRRLVPCSFCSFLFFV